MKHLIRLKYIGFVVALALWTLSVFPSLVSSQSCCQGQQQGCDYACPWVASCRKGTDLDCMDGISNGWECRDFNACRDYESCDEEQAALRTGQLCHSFPWYNGGYPLETLKFEAEKDNFHCQNTSTNGLYCQDWSTSHDSLKKLVMGEGTCKNQTSSGAYCEVWSVTETSVRKCWYDWVSTEEDGMQWAKICCSKTQRDHPCCRDTCSPEFYNGRPHTVEMSDCMCNTTSSSGQYCDTWSCLDVTPPSDGTSVLTYDSEPVLELTEFACKSSDENESFCTGWEGEMDNAKEFRLSNCWCDTGSSNGNYCETWTCLEKGREYWWPNLLYITLSCFLCAILQIGFLIMFLCFRATILQDYLNTYFVGYLVSITIWSTGFVYIGVWKTGLWTLFVCLLQIYVLPLPFYLYFLSVHLLAERKEAIRRSRLRTDEEGSDIASRTAAAAAAATRAERDANNKSDPDGIYVGITASHPNPGSSSSSSSSGSGSSYRFPFSGTGTSTDKTGTRAVSKGGLTANKKYTTLSSVGDAEVPAFPTVRDTPMTSTLTSMPGVSSTASAPVVATAVNSLSGELTGMPVAVATAVDMSSTQSSSGSTAANRV